LLAANVRRKIHAVGTPLHVGVLVPGLRRLISIVICTWNRSRLLAGTLDHLTRLDPPVGMGWEVLVVDNRCTDDTAAVLNRFRNRLPLRTVVERSPGLSIARNTGIRTAAGDWIVFVDDDVETPPGWLRAYEAAFEASPDAAVFGGPIEPKFEGGAPAWLLQALPYTAAAYAAIDLGPVRKPLTSVAMPYGANMAFRRATLGVEPFSPDLGRTGGNLIGYEEIALIQRLLESGHSGWWVPEARLRHVIPPARQTVRYLWRYWRSSAVSVQRAGIAAEAGRPGPFGVPWWVWKQAVAGALGFLWWRLLRRPDVWIRHLRAAAEAQGWIDEGMRRRHLAKFRPT
jgi:glycosyltransferase involved in cell wall biosynthesis